MAQDGSDRTDLLVVGAGPYAYSAAACAREHGIRTTVVGLPMSFWRRQMPADMLLRSGADWHLDAAGVHTFEAYFEDHGLEPADHDPVPIGVFLDHTDWFARAEGARCPTSASSTPWPPTATASSRRWRTARRSPPRRCWPHPASGTSSTCPRGTTACPRTAGRTRATSSTSTAWPTRAWSSSVVGRAPTSGRRCSATTERARSTSCTAIPLPSSSGSAGPSSTPMSSRPSRSAAGGGRCPLRNGSRSRRSSGRSADSRSSPGWCHDCAHTS